MLTKSIFRLINIGLITLFLFVGCNKELVFNTPEPIDLSGWENSGSVNASFLATGRYFESTSSSGSPTFTVGYLATASNIDSLTWRFQGGTPATSTLVQESVTYANFGTYGVELKVFNLEDRDTRYYEDFIRLYYKDDWSFSSDSWTVTGTTAPSDFEAKTDQEGNTLASWIVVPHTVANEAECYKDFSGFPSNNLILEFEYKLEKIPELYVATSYSVSSTTTTIASGTSVTNTFTLTTLDNPITYVDATASSSPTKFDSPDTYPGLRRLSLNYNGIPIWITSRMTEGLFKRVKLSLPSLTDFKISFVKSESTLNEFGVIQYPFHTEIRNITIKLEEEE